MAGDLVPKLQEKLAQRLKKSYPHSRADKEVEFRVDTTGGQVDVRPQSEAQILRLSSEDAINIVLIKPRSLVTSRLPPYPGWEALRDRARENWSSWRAIAPSFDVERVGVRYINRIDLPGGTINLGHYLAFRPQLANISAGPISGYTLQVALPTFKPLWSATLTSTIIQPPPVPDRTSILLDIDVYRADQLPKRDEELWPVVDEAQAVKNDLFERCITPAARELFRT
jgi:uncharacterized protein (TIGR04255 family)